MESKFLDIAIKGIQCVIPNDSDTARSQKVSDLCYAAVEKLLEKLQWSKDEIRALIMVTQTSDYLLPSTAFLLQKRLGIGFDCLTYDINLGGTGFLIGMQFVASLLSSFGDGSKGILITGDAAFNMEEASAGIMPCGAATGIQFGEKGELVVRSFSYGEEFDVILQESKKGKVEFDHKRFKDAIQKNAFEQTMSFYDGSQQQVDYLVTNLDDEDLALMENVKMMKKEGLTKKVSVNNSAIIPILICENRECLKEHNKLLITAAGAGCSLGIARLEVDKDSLYHIEKTDEIYVDEI